MIALSDPTGKKKKPTGYEEVLKKTLGDKYGSVPQERIDMFNKILSSGNLLENRGEVGDALRFLVDNYGMNTDSLTKNIVDYNVERKDLGMFGSAAEKAKIMAGMKVMGFNDGGVLDMEEGDPKKESTGYAALDARLARLAEQAQSDSIPQTPQVGYLDKEGRKTVQRYYESSNNPLADSGFAKGLYGISEAAMTDAIRAGVIPAGADVTDPEVNLLVRNYMLNALADKDFIKNPPKPISPMNRRSRIYMAYNFGGNKLLKQMEFAKAAGAPIYSDNPRDFIEFKAPKGTPGAIYDGYFYPKETRDYGLVIPGAAKADPNRLPKELYEKYYNQK